MSAGIGRAMRELLEFLVVAEGQVGLADLVLALPGATGAQLADAIAIARAVGWVESTGAANVFAGDARWWITMRGCREIGVERFMSPEGVPC